VTGRSAAQPEVPLRALFTVTFSKILHLLRETAATADPFVLAMDTIGVAW
jgi:hypothetical protein